MKSNLVWKLGTINVAFGIALKGYIFHKVNYSSATQRALKNANDLHLLSALGLCLISFKKSSLVKYVAMTKMTGILLGPGIMYYQAFYGDYYFRKIVPYGGTLIILGWGLCTLIQQYILNLYLSYVNQSILIIKLSNITYVKNIGTDAINIQKSFKLFFPIHFPVQIQ